MSLDVHIAPDLEDEKQVCTPRAASRALHPIPISGREPDAGQE